MNYVKMDSTVETYLYIEDSIWTKESQCEEDVELEYYGNKRFGVFNNLIYISGKYMSKPPEHFSFSS